MRQMADKVNGQSVQDYEWNPAQDELQNIVTDTSQTLNAGDNYQLSKAISNYSSSGDYFIDTGTANNYVLGTFENKKPPTKYFDGLRVRFRPANANTGISTITISGLSSQPLKKGILQTPNDLVAGDLNPNYITEAFYYAASNCFIVSPASYTQIIVVSQLPTGMVVSMPCLRSNTPAGWVIMDDGTIGDATSGASTRANADCQNLFVFLWNNVINANAPVSGGRGVSAIADWNAHKTIKLLSTLGRVIVNATNQALGDVIGESSHALLTTELAAHEHKYSKTTQYYGSPGGALPCISQDKGYTDVATTTAGGDDAHNNMQPSAYMYFFIKL